MSWYSHLTLSPGRRPFLFRLALVLAVSTPLALYGARAGLSGYWRGTHYRADTMHLNLLHRTLPTAAAVAIHAGRLDALREMLNADFGILDVFVTDADGKELLMRSRGVYSAAVPEPANFDLLSEPFDLVLDPPDPAAASAVYPSVDSETPSPGPRPRLEGRKVLARIYYRRRAPTGFRDVLAQWLGKPLSSSPPASIVRDSLLLASLIAVVLVALYEMTLRRRQADLAAKELELSRALDERLRLGRELAAEASRRDELERELKREQDEYERVRQRIAELEVALGAETEPDDRSATSTHLEALKGVAGERVARIQELSRRQQASEAELGEIAAERERKDRLVESLRQVLKRERRAFDEAIDEAAERERAYAESVERLKRERETAEERAASASDELEALRRQLGNAQAAVAGLARAMVAGLPPHEGKVAIGLSGEHHSTTALRPVAERLARAAAPYVRRVETHRWLPAQRRTLAVRPPGDKLRVVLDGDAGYALLLVTTARNAAEGNALADLLRDRAGSLLEGFEVQYLVATEE